MKEYYRVWAEIDLDAICFNLKETKKRIKPGTKIMAVIKADGYGHGAVPIAKVLDSIVDAYGVAILEEGIELRRAGITKPILVLGYTQPELYSLMIEYNIMTTVFQFDMAQRMSQEAIRQGKIAKIHIKLDTGMSRIGFYPTIESREEIKKIKRLPGIEIDGLFTHFAKADEANKEFTNIQFERYMNFIKQLEQEEIDIPVKHVSNSAGIIDIPDVNLNMVRSGISTYGLYPSEEVEKRNLKLKPAMSIRAKISYVKEVEPGIGISYGSTFVTQRKTKVATIPVGYGDGYPRALSNQARVLIHGKSAPILGRICMDQFMIDVTEIEDVSMGDIVTLVGEDGTEQIQVEELSQIAYSFPYEFVCDVGKRIPRVYYYKQQKVGTLDFYNCIESTYDLKELEKKL